MMLPDKVILSPELKITFEREKHRFGFSPEKESGYTVLCGGPSSKIKEGLELTIQNKNKALAYTVYVLETEDVIYATLEDIQNKVFKTMEIG